MGLNRGRLKEVVAKKSALAFAFLSWPDYCVVY